MKFFITFQEKFGILGLRPSNESTQNCLSNRRLLFGFTLSSCSVVLHFMSIFYVATDFLEYMEGVCTTSASMLVFVFFVAIVSRRASVFKSIDDIGKLIDSSKAILVIVFGFIGKQFYSEIFWILGCEYPESRGFFLKISKEVEQFNRMVFMWVAKILVLSIVLPKCFGSFATYLITDLGRDSFQLPVPLW